MHIRIQGFPGLRKCVFPGFSGDKGYLFYLLQAFSTIPCAFGTALGNVQDEATSLPQRAFYPYTSPNRADDILYNREPETGSLTGALGGIEGLKNLLQRIIGDAAARVGDLKSQRILVQDLHLDAQFLLGCFFHRLKGIFAEIQKNVLCHALPAQNITGYIWQHGFHGNGRRCQLLYEGYCIFHFFGEIQKLQTHTGVLSGKCQQLPGKIRGLVYRCCDFVDHFLVFRRDARIVFQKLRINQYRCQIVVEFMGDVAGHHAERLNALVVPDFIVFLGQHFHALVEGLQMCNFLLLRFCQKTVSKQCDGNDDQQQNIEECGRAQHTHHTVQRTGKLSDGNGGVDDPAFSLNINGLKSDHPLYLRQVRIVPDIGIDHTGSGGICFLLLNPGIHAAQVQVRVFTAPVVQRLESDLVLGMVHDDVHILILDTGIPVLSDLDRCNDFLIQGFQIHGKGQGAAVVSESHILLNVQLIPAGLIGDFLSGDPGRGLQVL